MWKWMNSENGRALRDWLGLFFSAMIPVVLVVVANQFSQSQRATDLEIESERQNEAALQSYLDDMTALIIDKNLSTSEPGSEVRAVARSRTLTVLRSLDGKRKGSVVNFLIETDLITHDYTGWDVIIDLKGADLQNADLRGMEIINANLRQVDLSQADLSWAILHNSDLSRSLLANAELVEADLSQTYVFGSDFSGANLEGAFMEALWVYITDMDATEFCKEYEGSSNYCDGAFIKLSPLEFDSTKLVGVNLSNAYLSEVKIIRESDMTGIDLSGSDLSNANFQHAILKDADLQDASLISAFLSFSNLQGADLRGADMRGVDFTGTDLTDAKVSKEQLEQASSLEETIMPDGTVHE
jgi:uncharacterized protein YjbI with pentapeptide repeats